MPRLTSIRVLRRLAQLTAETVPTITPAGLVVLSLVAEEEGRTVSEYAKAAGIPMQTASRILSDLSGRNRPGQVLERPTLLERIQSPMNLREVTYRLSGEGRAFITKMANVLIRGGQDLAAAGPQ